ncbi:hypothetical protein ACRRVA_02705 [Candidatus Cardinium hertigii]|uniref:hypothetical protein n=1 Tax=Candidatus Cardinium hertigii TaxID=247481 RepID=UPI003D7D2B4B
MKNNIKKFVYGSIVALSAYSCFDKLTPPNNPNHSGNKKLKEGGSKNLDDSKATETPVAEPTATIGIQTETVAENGAQTETETETVAENGTQTQTKTVAENGTQTETVAENGTQTETVAENGTQTQTETVAENGTQAQTAATNGTQAETETLAQTQTKQETGTEGANKTKQNNILLAIEAPVTVPVTVPVPDLLPTKSEVVKRIKAAAAVAEAEKLSLMKELKKNLVVEMKQQEDMSILTITAESAAKVGLMLEEPVVLANQQNKDNIPLLAIEDRKLGASNKKEKQELKEQQEVPIKPLTKAQIKTEDKVTSSTDIDSKLNGSNTQKKKEKGNKKEEE